MNADVAADNGIPRNFDIAVLVIETVRVCNFGGASVRRGKYFFDYGGNAVVHGTATVVYDFDVVAGMNIHYLALAKTEHIVVDE